MILKSAVSSRKCRRVDNNTCYLASSIAIGSSNRSHLQSENAWVLYSNAHAARAPSTEERKRVKLQGARLKKTQRKEKCHAVQCLPLPHNGEHIQSVSALKRLEQKNSVIEENLVPLPILAARQPKKTLQPAVVWWVRNTECARAVRNDVEHHGEEV